MKAKTRRAAPADAARFAPRIQTALPGPKSKAVIERDRLQMRDSIFKDDQHETVPACSIVLGVCVHCVTNLPRSFPTIIAVVGNRRHSGHFALRTVPTETA